jgi:hypothetical protein
MKQKLSTETPVCPQERLVIISYTTGLSFALERIGPLAAIIIIVFYLLVLYLLALPNTPENPFASIYSESLIKTACQHPLLLVGFNTVIYRKYYDTPPILVGHQLAMLVSGWMQLYQGMSPWSLISLDLKRRQHLEKYWVVSFFGIRNTSCFQAQRQGGHPLLWVLAIHHL